MPGAYILVIKLNIDKKIRIGSLGNLIFQKGYYCYVGSAMGTKGASSLLCRVRRHVSPSSMKKIHWHIDYLLNDENSRIIKLILIPSKQKMECCVAGELFDKADDEIKNFGSSDCYCSSHLFYFSELKLE
ncbi:MAG: GIY-YIG nuclease family protein [Candidatus Lokiarchaeota archaeon]|nr:GIY-YIG nuclease family protein [Candidatus Lokiarchaeota archaeon]